ncbi:hypothetical protein [Agromyces kandeliae]|uniref:WD40 repeat domain-containing protein n=1 Tax=Agromyces kandeliae TaxID=2666141 RepID=A0A6L5QXX8_9MICO|nr:hypothetical protein [Agromyces kandeliae]MRX42503.1 hypothetical protein [Agromyces kandeliae]
MITTTPLPSPASAPAESREDERHATGRDRSSGAREERAGVDASATRPPVEVLIEEARHRARRRRQLVGAVAIAAVAIAAIAVTATLDGAGSSDGAGTSLGGQVDDTSLGVFEPMRGRIVWAADGELRAVDPADPTDIRRIALPDDVDAAAMVSGWSADGTRLALTSEDAGKLYVVDARGTVALAGETGCCLFVSDPWLAPDGSTVAEFVAPGRLQLRDVSGLTRPRQVDVDPAFGREDGPPVIGEAWSPDGSRIALRVYEDEVMWTQPSIFVFDLVAGTAREVRIPEIDFIRHMTWSPDGARLLVVAGTYVELNGVNLTGPPVGPQNTSLYLVDAAPDTSVPAQISDPIASSHFIAATWSPDGEQIAAIDYVGRRGIVVMNPDGSEAHRIVPSLGTSAWTGLAWHPIPSTPR